MGMQYYLIVHNLSKYLVFEFYKQKYGAPAACFCILYSLVYFSCWRDNESLIALYIERINKELSALWKFAKLIYAPCMGRQKNYTTYVSIKKYDFILVLNQSIYFQILA